MKIRISRAHHPVTALGPGRRIGIWVQGCSLACPGCMSTDTWARDRGTEMEVDALVGWCRRIGDDVDGVTISGGEPLQQPAAVAALLERLHGWRRGLDREVDFLCYSGLPWTTVERDHAAVLALLDAIIPEPFVEALPVAPLAGSMNQPVVALTDLGRRRYAPADAPATAQPVRRRMQAHLDGQRAWFIGIPDRGDMERLATMCRDRGLVMEDVSWPG